jgi:hypothetical protein
LHRTVGAGGGLDTEVFERRWLSSSSGYDAYGDVSVRGSESEVILEGSVQTNELGSLRVD